IYIWFDPSTQWYAQPQGKQGRNQTYSDTAIQCCLMMKSLFRLSLRMVTGFVQSLIKLCGLNWTAPDYSTLCRRQKHIDIAISYQKSHDGLHLLVDSTGLKDRKSTRLNSSHVKISYAVFCLKKKKS